MTSRRIRGANLFIRKRPNATTAYAPLIGLEASGERAETVQSRVPPAKNWLVAMPDRQGCTVPGIARKPRLSAGSVRATRKTRREKAPRR